MANAASINACTSR